MPLPYDKYAKAGAFHWQSLESDGFYRLRVQNLLGHVRNGSRCLDVGCGDGAYLGVIAKKCSQATGVDGEKLAVKLARRELAARGIKNVEVIWSLLKDARARIPTKAFDLVYAMDVIEHLDNPGELTTLALHALKDTGLLVIGTPLFMGQKNVSPYHEKEFTLPELRGLLEKDFKVVSVSGLPDQLADKTVSSKRFAVVVSKKRAAKTC